MVNVKYIVPDNYFYFRKEFNAETPRRWGAEVRIDNDGISKSFFIPANLDILSPFDYWIIY